MGRKVVKGRDQILQKDVWDQSTESLSVWCRCAQGSGRAGITATVDGKWLRYFVTEEMPSASPW